MRSYLQRSLLGAALPLALAALPSPTLAQAPQPVASPRSLGAQPTTANSARPATSPTEPGVHQLVIFNGPSRTVRYFAPAGSPGEQASLRQLEQAENELAVNDSLQGLRQQYINTESLMEARRREVQRKLYGVSMTDRVSNSATYSGVGLGQPSPYGTPSLMSPFGWWGFAGASPWSAYGSNQVTLHQESQTSQSLAHGIGDEGQFKRALVTEMARQATPESAATALRNYESALANLGNARSGGITAATAETRTPRRVVVTMKDGEKIAGSLIREEGGWITIRTPDAEERIRQQDVSRIKMEIARDGALAGSR